MMILPRLGQKEEADIQTYSLGLDHLILSLWKQGDNPNTDF